MKYLKSTGVFYPQELKKKKPFFTLQTAKCTISVDGAVKMNVRYYST